MKKHRIVIPIKVEQILAMLKGNTLIFNDEVEIIPEMEDRRAKQLLLQRITSMNNMNVDLADELKQQLELVDEEIQIFNSQRIK